MILQSEIKLKEEHRDWLLKLARMAEPTVAEQYRQEAREISRAIKQARERA